MLPRNLTSASRGISTRRPVLRCGSSPLAIKAFTCDRETPSCLAVPSIEYASGGASSCFTCCTWVPFSWVPARIKPALYVRARVRPCISAHVNAARDKPLRFCYSGACNACALLFESVHKSWILPRFCGSRKFLGEYRVLFDCGGQHSVFCCFTAFLSLAPSKL